MFGYDYSAFFTTESAAQRADLITGGVNHILAPGDEDTAREFVEQAGMIASRHMDLQKARATDLERTEAGYLQV